MNETPSSVIARNEGLLRLGRPQKLSGAEARRYGQRHRANPGTKRVAINAWKTDFWEKRIVQVRTGSLSSLKARVLQKRNV